MDEIKILTRLGFTSNEAKVYLAMCTHGKQSVKTISQCSGVAREVAYKVLKKLHAKGFVEEVLTVPKKFVAIPKESAYMIIFEQRKMENKYLWAQIQQNIGKRKQNTNGDTIFDEDETLIFSYNTIMPLRIKIDMANTQDSIDMIISWKKFVRLAQIELEPNMENFINRNVKLRIITDKVNENGKLNGMENFPHDLFSKLQYINFKFIKNFPKVEFTIHDGTHIYISLKKSKYIDNMTWLFSSNQFIIEISKKYFENLWYTPTEVQRT
ncbi:MAG: helix-turn-helix domain-containing protein [Candidatus Bathyarchaeota archaeon]|nr:helix-turn-helix domain-containing protein [Candidatus Bathyarchaeum sp.]